MTAKTYSNPSQTYSFTIPYRDILWPTSLTNTVTLGDGAIELCLKEFAFLSYPVRNALFASDTYLFQRDLSAHSRGMFKYLSPL